MDRSHADSTLRPLRNQHADRTPTINVDGAAIARVEKTDPAPVVEGRGGCRQVRDEYGSAVGHESGRYRSTLVSGAALVPTLTRRIDRLGSHRG